jgi:hypothetical protein
MAKENGGSQIHDRAKRNHENHPMGNMNRVCRKPIDPDLEIPEANVLNFHCCQSHVTGSTLFQKKLLTTG